MRLYVLLRAAAATIILRARVGARRHWAQGGRANSGLQRFYDWLDGAVFPRIITYTTHRLHITALGILWALLLVSGGWVAFELVAGNYMNGLSAMASCIVLLQQVSMRKQHQQHTDELKAQAAEHHAALTQAHADHRAAIGEQISALEAKLRPIAGDAAMAHEHALHGNLAVIERIERIEAALEAIRQAVAPAADPEQKAGPTHDDAAPVSAPAAQHADSAAPSAAATDAHPAARRSRKPKNV